MDREKRVGRRQSLDSAVEPGPQIMIEADRWLEAMILRSSQESKG
jgi:hypothetical protein